MNRRLKVECSPDWKRVHIYKSSDEIPAASPKQVLAGSGNILMQTRRRRSIREQENKSGNSDTIINACDQFHLPITVFNDTTNRVLYYNTSVSAL